MFSWNIVVGLAIYSISSVVCFPRGAPRGACSSRLPYHTSSEEVYVPQTTSSPYTVSVNVTEFRPGDTISVTIRSTVEGVAFRGFLLQARPVMKSDVDFRDRSLGRFHNLGANSKPLTCDVALEAATHTDAFAKYNLTLDWKAPLLIKNDLVMIATFVTNFSTFWVDVKSPEIKLIREGQLPAEGLGTPWLKEMMKTSSVASDKKATRELVKARFEKGFRGAIDPNGFIMVHYVLDVLPFEVSLPSKYVAKTTPANSTTVSINTTTDTQIITTTSPQTGTNNSDSQVTSLPFDNQTNIIVNTTPSMGVFNDTHVSQTIKQSDKKKQNEEKYFENLVKAFLKGDKSVMNDLTDIIQKKEDAQSPLKE